MGALRIGCWETDTPEYFNGTIDEARIYNTAISEDRIRSRYLGGISAHKSLDNNLVMHFGNATITTDVSTLSGWHHVAGTFGDGKAYLYVDGVQKATADFSAGKRRIFGDYGYFGNDENNAMEFTGKLDEVRILNFARTAFNGGVVMNKVSWESGNKYIQLYNNAGSSVNIRGFKFLDDAGNVIAQITSDTNVSSGGYYTINDTSGYLDSIDSIRVYDLDPDNDGTNENTQDYKCLVDFVAWGSSCPQQCNDSTDDAVKAGLWTGGMYSSPTGDEIHLTIQGNNDEVVDDWSGNPTAVTLSFFTARSGSRGIFSPWPWLGLVGLAALGMGGVVWVKRRPG